MNEFMELSTSTLMNLDHTYRYSGTKLVEKETLSQHIVDTIMMGLKIIDNIEEIRRSDSNNDTGILSPFTYVMKAIHHDLEEAITGDVPRPLKYYSKSTKESLSKVADEVARGLFEKEFNYPDAHYEYWESAKSGREGFILKLVDMLVVAHKVVKEVQMLHNFYMLRVAHEVSYYLKEFDKEQDKVLSSLFEDEPGVSSYLRSLVGDAIITMFELISKYDPENLYAPAS